MLLTTNATETNCNLKAESFTIKASPIAFEILSSKLYSNPVLAVIRELICNAYDAQKSIHNENTKIDIILPTAIEENIFSIRDYGPGLSEEDIFTLYTSFFSSTKSSSNDFTGCFGLGSKTPFAINSSFTVVSYYDGTMTTYVCSKKDGFPSVIKINSVPTNEHSGLKVTIPVPSNFKRQFTDEFVNYMQFMPEINVNVNKGYNESDTQNLHNNEVLTLENIKFISNINDIRYSGYLDKIYIKQGQNVYHINDIIGAKEYSSDKYSNKLSAAYSLGNLAQYSDTLAVIEVPIGTFNITPSRESLALEDTTYNTILEQCDKANSIVTKYAIDNAKIIFKDGSSKEDQYSYKNIIRFVLNDYINSLLNETYIKAYGFTYNGDIEFASYLGLKDPNDLKSSPYFLRDTDMYLIVSKSKLNRGILTKIRRILEDYSDKHVLIYSDTNLNRTQLEGLHKLVNTVNSLTFLNYNVKIITYNQFIKKFPIVRKKKSSKDKPSKVELEKGYRVWTATLNNGIAWGDPENVISRYIFRASNRSFLQSSPVLIFPDNKKGMMCAQLLNKSRTHASIYHKIEDSIPKSPVNPNNIYMLFVTESQIENIHKVLPYSTIVTDEYVKNILEGYTALINIYNMQSMKKLLKYVMSTVDFYPDKIAEKIKKTYKYKFAKLILDNISKSNTIFLDSSFHEEDLVKLGINCRTMTNNNLLVKLKDFTDLMNLRTTNCYHSNHNYSDKYVGNRFVMTNDFYNTRQFKTDILKYFFNR